VKPGCRTWVVLGLNKGRGRFLNFSDAPILAENAKLDYVIDMYFVIIFCFLLVNSAGL
jgi:hypothetical protein